MHAIAIDEQRPGARFLPMDTALNTDAVAPRERLAFWRDSMAALYGTRILGPTTPAPFFGRVVQRAIGPLVVCQFSAAGQRMERGWAEIRALPLEVDFVHLQTHGTVDAEQSGRGYRLAPGDLDLVNGCRPCVASMEGRWRFVGAVIPHAVLRNRLRRPDAVDGLRLGTASGAGALAAQHLRALAERQLPESVEPAFAEVLVNVLTLAFGATAEAAQAAQPSLREARRHGIREYVEHHLHDPALSPERVARHFHLTKRYLHKLFREAGTSLMHLVQARRLARSREALAAAGQRGRSITEIALDCGFQDASHFCRAFKRAYQVTPRDWRAQSALAAEGQSPANFR